MPVINRKRRAAEPEASPPPTRRRCSPPLSETSSIGEDIDGDLNGGSQSSSHDQMVKKLVRLALACEYSRQLLRRTDITAKVMAPNTGRQFKNIFEAAQEQLRTVFGMEMTELPQREKTTISQKRAAARSSQSASSSKTYILTSTLPARYRRPKVLQPAQIPSTAAESAYVGLTTFVVALIYLSPSNQLAENRLEKHLKRMNADNYVLSGEKTENVLKRMERDKYIIKVRERDNGGEETVDYVVGPRGRVEVAEKGVAGLVRTVYGKQDAEAEELDRRLVRSLGEVVLEGRRRRDEGAEDTEVEENGDPERQEQEEEETLVEDETRQGHGKKASKQQTRRLSARVRRRTQDVEEDKGEEEEKGDEEGEDEEGEEGEEEDDSE